MPKIFIIIIFFLLSLILYLSDSFVYPIEEVEITSTTSNYDTEKINDIVASIQGQDLLSLDLSDIKRSIRSDDWIRDVEIKKSFPDTLEIIIIPQQPFAIYNSKIMMIDGTVIKASSYGQIWSFAPAIIIHGRGDISPIWASNSNHSNMLGISLNPEGPLLIIVLLLCRMLAQVGYGIQDIPKGVEDTQWQLLVLITLKIH